MSSWSWGHKKNGNNTKGRCVLVLDNETQKGTDIRDHHDKTDDCCQNKKIPDDLTTGDFL